MCIRDRTSGSSTSVSNDGVLKLESQGAEVRNLQINLTKLGYYTATVSGHFGEKTEAAVKAFQEKNGLKADGIAGKATLQKITALLGGTSSGSSSSTTLKYGSEGELVKKLQQKLADLKLYSGKVTGHYGYKTVEAVKSYQEKNKLTVDGIAGRSTLLSLGVIGGSEGESGGSDVTLTSNYGRTEKDKVIVRSYYTTSSNEKTRLAKGTYFKILSTHASGGYTWLRIEVKGTTGYIRSDMAHVLTATEAQEYLNNQNSGSGDHEDVYKRQAWTARSLTDIWSILTAQ